MNKGWLIVAALSVLPLAPASAQGVPPGSYECWYSTRAQPGLNFCITGNGSYTDVEGKRGAFSLGNGNAMSFQGGAHDGSRAVYKGGNPPTISFLGPSGNEAAFCQRAGS